MNLAKDLGGHIIYHNAEGEPIGAVCNSCHFDLETSHKWLSEDEEEKKFMVLDKWCGKCRANVEKEVLKPDAKRGEESG